MAIIPKIIADFEAQLATAISIGSTSFTLSTATDDDGVALPAGLYYFTVDNGSNSKEYLAGTLSGTSVTGVVNVSRQGVETSGAVRAHRIGASVIITDFATYKKYIDNTTASGAPNATTSVQGLVELGIAAEIDAGTATGGTGAALAVTPDQLALSIYGTRLPSAAEKSALAGLSGLTGAIVPYAGRSAPSGYLLCDGSLVSRSTYASLFAVISPSQTFTVTIATPGVFTVTAHGLVVGDKVHLSTTGGLPSGLAANTDYFVSVVTDANTIRLATVPGGSDIATSGSQSGVHTIYKSAWGKGDGSTTFQLPDFRARMPVGLAATAPTSVLTFQDGQVNTGTDLVTILDTVYPAQGQAVVLSSTGTLPGGLSATTYYIIRASATTIKFATSQSNANIGTAVDITSAAGGGVHSMIFTHRTHTVVGRYGGEETHGQSRTEMPAHTHNNAKGVFNSGGARNNTTGGGGNLDGDNILTDSTGGDGVMNIMQPFAVVNYIIKT